MQEAVEMDYIGQFNSRQYNVRNINSSIESLNKIVLKTRKKGEEMKKKRNEERKKKKEGRRKKKEVRKRKERRRKERMKKKNESPLRQLALYGHRHLLTLHQKRQKKRDKWMTNE